jgi:uncharacterized protein (UPF0297 family)
MSKVLRNEDGLLDSLEYEFYDSGLVNWRAMIPPEYVFFNKERIIRDEIDLDLDVKDSEEINKIKKSLDDKYLIISLAGYKYIANIRGYLSIKNNPSYSPEGVAYNTCKIVWLPNFETSNRVIKTSSIAEASLDNTKDEMNKFLLVTAENRSFSRCVRNFLRIDSVSESELEDSSKKTAENLNFVSNEKMQGPSGVLAKKLKSKKISFAHFHEFVVSNWSEEFENCDEWSSVGDLSPQEASVFLNRLDQIK